MAKRKTVTFYPPGTEMTFDGNDPNAGQYGFFPITVVQWDSVPEGYGSNGRHVLPKAIVRKDRTGKTFETFQHLLKKRNPFDWHGCIDKVSRQPGIYSPGGVCATAERRKMSNPMQPFVLSMYDVGEFRSLGEQHFTAAKDRDMAIKELRRSYSIDSSTKSRDGRWLKLTIRAKRNPDELESVFSPESTAGKLALAAAVPGGAVALTALELAEAVDRGLVDESAAVLMRPMEAVGSAVGSAVDLVANGRRSRYRRNPEFDSSAMYESFHGTPSTKDLEILEEIHEHGHLAALGTLCELKVACLSGKNVEIQFDPDDNAGPFLAANEAGTQLYIVGGDQSVDISAMGMGGNKWQKEHMVLGVCYEVTYRTRKGFDSFQLTDYYHELGEETGVQPMLMYDTVNQKLSIAGGQYEIRPEGITN